MFDDLVMLPARVIFIQAALKHELKMLEVSGVLRARLRRAVTEVDQS